MKKKITIEEAMDVIREAIKTDDVYAWGWFCNIAMAAKDEGAPMPQARKTATRLMRWAFGRAVTEDLM
jgi:hypothetical protein